MAIYLKRGGQLWRATVNNMKAGVPASGPIFDVTTELGRFTVTLDELVSGRSDDAKRKRRRSRLTGCGSSKKVHSATIVAHGSSH